MQERSITNIPPRAAKYYQRTPQTTAPPIIQPPIPQSRHTFFPAFAVGMLCIALVIVLWTMVVSPFLTGIENQWHYGDAKIAAFSANVGHGGISSFYAFTVDKRIVVIEIPSHQEARVFMGAFFLTTPKENRIVSLTTADVNHDGKPDLVLHIEGMEITPVLFNTGTSFSWTSQ